MKIIATTLSGYLIEARGDELSNLMGFANDYRRMEDRDGYGRRNYEGFAVGHTIPIHKMFDRLYRMANLEKELTEISAKLKAASDFVNTALPTIGRVNEEKGL